MEATLPTARGFSLRYLFLQRRPPSLPGGVRSSTGDEVVFSEVALACVISASLHLTERKTKRPDKLIWKTQPQSGGWKVPESGIPTS